MDSENMTPEQIVRLLKQAGSQKITLEKVQIDMQEGDFTNSNDNINFLEYLAWLLKNKSTR